MTARALRLAALVVAAAAVAGCATPVAAPGEPPWTSGRLAVAVAATPREPSRRVTAAFDLRGDGRSGELLLNTPIGTRIAQARWAPGVAVLETSDGERRYPTLDELSREALGEALPLAALPDWVAGRPTPTAPHRVTDDGFEQLGWSVRLAGRGEGRIELRRAAPPVVVVRLRIDDAGRSP